MTPNELALELATALDNMKALHVTTLDVTQMTPLTDYMIICTGNSIRHVKALAQEVIAKTKQFCLKVRGIEGEQEGEWVLVDCYDVIVHVMQQKARDFYELEKLWTVDTEKSTLKVHAH